MPKFHKERRETKEEEFRKRKDIIETGGSSSASKPFDGTKAKGSSRVPLDPQSVYMQKTIQAAEGILTPSTSSNRTRIERESPAEAEQTIDTRELALGDYLYRHESPVEVRQVVQRAMSIAGITYAPLADPLHRQEYQKKLNDYLDHPTNLSNRDIMHITNHLMDHAISVGTKVLEVCPKEAGKEQDILALRKLSEDWQKMYKKHDGFYNKNIDGNASFNQRELKEAFGTINKYQKKLLALIDSTIDPQVEKATPPDNMLTRFDDILNKYAKTNKELLDEFYMNLKYTGQAENTIEKLRIIRNIIYEDLIPSKPYSEPSSGTTLTSHIPQFGTPPSGYYSGLFLRKEITRQEEKSNA